jgi:hypothetical protein
VDADAGSSSAGLAAAPSSREVSEAGSRLCARRARSGRDDGCSISQRQTSAPQKRNAEATGRYDRSPPWIHCVFA